MRSSTQSTRSFLAIPLAGRPGAEGQAIREQTFSQALGQAFSHRSYLLLTAGFFVCGFHLAFVTTHLPPYIVDKGLDPRIGAWALAAIGFFNIFGCDSGRGHRAQRPRHLRAGGALRLPALKTWYIAPGTHLLIYQNPRRRRGRTDDHPGDLGSRAGCMAT